jgi:hypothetical protein
MKIEIISEDDLLEMIRTRPGDEKPSTSKVIAKRKSSSSIIKTTESSVIPKTTTTTTTIDNSNLLCKLFLI